jgi:hypothetical protein
MCGPSGGHARCKSFGVQSHKVRRSSAPVLLCSGPCAYVHENSLHTSALCRRLAVRSLARNPFNPHVLSFKGTTGSRRQHAALLVVGLVAIAFGAFAYASRASCTLKTSEISMFASAVGALMPCPVPQSLQLVRATSTGPTLDPAPRSAGAHRGRIDHARSRAPACVLGTAHVGTPRPGATCSPLLQITLPQGLAYPSGPGALSRTSLVQLHGFLTVCIERVPLPLSLFRRGTTTRSG